MPQLFELSTFGSEMGRLSVFEKMLPNDIKRVFYIYGVAPDQKRAQHSHRVATNALIPVAGQCSVYVTNGEIEHTYQLNKPNQCLIIKPGEWHLMDNFSADAVLIVLSDQYYDKNDYVFDKP